MNEKQWIRSWVGITVDINEVLHRPCLDDVITGINEIMVEAKDRGYKDLKVEWDYEDASLKGWRLEDDGEYKARLIQETYRAEKERAKKLEEERKIKEAEEKERALYEELKKKYGGDK